MSDDKRPVWNHPIDVGLFRKLDGACITQITHHWEMTSEDTSRHWIKLQGEGVHVTVAAHEIPTLLQYFAFTPAHHATLFSTTPAGRLARADLEKIDKFDQRNKRDLREYRRLQKKFGFGL